MNQSGQDKHTPIGWREWINIPDWGVEFIKAKVDTGAKTSAIHVEDLEIFDKEGSRWVRFRLFPLQKAKGEVITAEAPLVENREVRSSSGHKEKRPVVKTALVLAGVCFEAEITLTNRDQMGFRMLLGREALKERFLVLPGKSYLGGKPHRDILRKNRGKH